MRRVAAAAVAVAVGLAVTGCVRLPVEGPVIESGAAGQGDPGRASDIDARPPSANATRTQVVEGFLEAMTAWPVQTSVAKQYLTHTAAAYWEPEQGTVIYGDTLPAREVGGSVTVGLTSADRLDAGGSWQGSLGPADLDLDFAVTVDNGEFRIANPPNALIVPSVWFTQRYREVSLYYFDPVAQMLVPEPVFVPAGEQLATSLVAGLLAGPPPRIRSIVRSFVPNGLAVGLSVPVDDKGVADIALTGQLPEVSAKETELMLAQFAWTLRQDPDISAFRLTIGNRNLALPGGAGTWPVSSGADFDPSGARATDLLFGLIGGRLVAGNADGMSPVTGPFGARDTSLESFAVTPDGARAAVVDRGGHRVRVAPIDQGIDPGPPVVVLRGRMSVAQPTWDAAGRLWLLDRRPDGAVVWVVDEGGARRVFVPGVSRTTTRRLLVSRDGTRLVAVVATASGDELFSTRVRIDARNRVVGVQKPLLIRAAQGTAITDVAWSSPTQVSLIGPSTPDTVAEVDTVSADGATFINNALPSILSGDVIGLAASPDVQLATFGVYSDRFVGIVGREQHDPVPGVIVQLDYPG